MDAASLARAAELLRGLHHAERPLLLPNAWDAGSAQAVERAGARVVATTSSAVAESLGYPDGEAIPVAEMLEAVGRIAGAVSLPVTADLEAGYGLDADELLAGVLRAGAVGLNLEDTDRSGTADALLRHEQAADRIAALRAAAGRAGVPVVINARIDSFLRGTGDEADRLADAIRRGRAYLDAGADCVYPIWLADADAIATLARELDAPVNILLRPGAPSLERLEELGVRRISVGGGLARIALGHAEEVARRLLAGDGSDFRERGEA